MRKIACAIAAGAALIATPAADAGTVDCRPGARYSSSVIFQAGDGEENRLEVRLDGGTLTVADRGPEMAVFGPCSRVSAHEVRFDAVVVDVYAGDGHDTVTTDTTSSDHLLARLDTGPGDDAIQASGGEIDVRTGDTPDGADQITLIDPYQAFLSYAGRSAPVRVTPDGIADDGELGEGDNVRGAMYVDGTPENDVLQAGTGDWVLRGGAGNDQLLGGSGNSSMEGGPGADYVAGGGGEDWVSYYGGTRGVSVTPDGVANDGAPGEGDNVAPDVEDALGTDLSDRLVGTAGPNNLDGLGGDDIVEGGDGNDIVHGGDGDDAISGGGGDDLLDALEADHRWDTLRGTDRVDCGEGSDLVYSNPTDRLAGDCEGGLSGNGTWGCSPPRTLPGGPFPAPAPCTPGPSVVSRGVAVVSLKCPRSAPRRCKGRTVLTAPRRTRASAARAARKVVVLGSRRVNIRRGRRVRVRIPLSRAGRRVVAARKRLMATVTLRYKVRPHRTRSLRNRVLLLAAR